jgi:hypothetical protein
LTKRTSDVNILTLQDEIKKQFKPCLS